MSEPSGSHEVKVNINWEQQSFMVSINDIEILAAKIPTNEDKEFISIVENMDGQCGCENCTTESLFNEIGYDDDDIRMDLDADTPSGRPHDPATCPDCEADYAVFRKLMDRWLKEQS